jgi:rRNA-processing protein FCF1
MEKTLASVAAQRREALEVAKNEIRHELTTADKNLKNVLWESGIDVAHEVMRARASLGKIRAKLRDIT